jgi:hypothetical protein
MTVFTSDCPGMERGKHLDGRYFHAIRHEPELMSSVNNLRRKPTDVKKKCAREY